MSSIETVLASLGDLQNLGRFNRVGFCWHKTYLAYEGKGHWKLLTLNPLQVFLRYIIGNHKNTHLAYVAHKWNRHQLRFGAVCPALTKKLEMLWSKTTPKKTYPPLAHFFGNAPLAQAQIIGIAALHSDILDPRISGKILSKHYRKGDVILIEGVDSDTSISSLHDPQTKFMHKSVPVRGWEPVGYTAMHAEIFKPTLELDHSFKKYSFQIKKWLENREQFSNEFFEGALRGFEELLTKMGNTPEELLSSYRSICLKLQISSKTTEDCKQFANEFVKIHASCQELLAKMKYTSLWTPAALKFFKETWAVRELSLCNEIDEYCAAGKRVFVCAGAAHFFPNRGKNKSEVVSTLRKYKFTIGLADCSGNSKYYSFDELRKQLPIVDGV